MEKGRYILKSIEVIEPSMAELIEQARDKQSGTVFAWLTWDNTEDKAELERAFNLLLGGVEAYNKEWGEAWQYVGTVHNWNGNQRWQHQFRHRAHPMRNNERYYQYIDCPEPRAENLVNRG